MEYFKQLDAVSTTEEASAVRAFLFRNSLTSLSFLSFSFAALTTRSEISKFIVYDIFNNR